MPSYGYPGLVLTGFLWNILQKISLALAVPMEQITLSGNTEQVFIGLPNELTPTQKSQLDAIVLAPDASLPPATFTGVRYKIMDLWGMRQRVRELFGVDFTMWFEPQTEDGSGECYIYIDFPALTVNQKKNIISQYAAMIKEA